MLEVIDDVTAVPTLIIENAITNARSREKSAPVANVNKYQPNSPAAVSAMVKIP
jgi:hypothetical protein